jgi:hypothetical protein
MLALGVVLAVVGPAHAAPLDSDITYQGELNLNGSPVNDTADFRFQLFNDAAAGMARSGQVPAANVQVVDGVFTANIDFGFDVFHNDEQLFMEIQVRSPAGAGVFTTLMPRQPITPSPFAVAARRGFVPWIVQTPASTNSVTIDPNSSLMQDMTRAGVSVASIEQSGPTGGGVFRATNEETGFLTAFWGTSFGDQSGFAALGAKDFSGEANSPIVLEADPDNNGANGVFEGSIRLRSIGTGGTGGSLLVRNNDGATTLDARGGASGAGASLNLLDPADGSSILIIEPNSGTEGTDIFGFSPAGDEQYRLEPDNNTDGGGYLLIDSGTQTFNSFQVDGNSGDSGSPSLLMFGASNFFVNGALMGNASVQMPGDAVASAEVLDEPGVASAQAGSVALTTTLSSILSRSITVPAAGFVIAFAQGDIAISHVTGIGSVMTWGVNDTAGVIPINGDIQVQLPSGAATGIYDVPASAHALFEVTAGVHTFHFNAREGGAEGTMFDVQLTLLYVPTAYGTVEPSVALSGLQGDGDDAPSFMPLTAEEIALERAHGEAFGQFRVQQELAAMKAEIEALKAMLKNDPNMQPQARPAPRPAAIQQGDQLGSNANHAEEPAPVDQQAPAAEAPMNK